MRAAFGKIIVVMIAFMLAGETRVSGSPPIRQDNRVQEQTIDALRAELQAARDDQARQLAIINALTAQAEKAKEDMKAAELRAGQWLRLSQDQLKSVETLAAAGGAETADNDNQNRLAQDLALAQSQHNAVADYLTQAQSNYLDAQQVYKWLSDAQGNAALQDFVIARANAANADQAESRDFWIGVQCEPAGEVQIRLDPSSDRLVTAKGGLRVISCTSDSPAQAAGILEQDVLLFMNDRPTNLIEELVAEIDENGENAASLEIVRDHNRMTLTITPRKRPQTETVAGVDLNLNPHWRRYQGVPLLSVETPKLPAGFEADIHFEGGEQPEFNIKTSDQSWTVNSESVDQLPEEVRPFAQHFHGILTPSGDGKLHAGQIPFYRTYLGLNAGNLRYGYPLGGQSGKVEATDAYGSSETNEKLDRLQKQLDDLRALIERTEK